MLGDDVAADDDGNGGHGVSGGENSGGELRYFSIISQLCNFPN